jgi:hypothetical protein
MPSIAIIFIDLQAIKKLFFNLRCFTPISA